MFNKKNQRKLNPQELRKQEELEKEQKRKGTIIKERIYPLLVENTGSIDDAKNFCQLVNLVIEQAFVNKKKEMIVADLKLIEDMKESSESERWKKMFDIIGHENITVALDLVGSMANIISNNERKESKDRKLSELPIEFITYGQK